MPPLEASVSACCSSVALVRQKVCACACPVISAQAPARAANGWFASGCEDTGACGLHGGSDRGIRQLRRKAGVPCTRGAQLLSKLSMGSSVGADVGDGERG